MEQNKLATTKVSKLLFQLAMPAICVQVVTLLYNMVDRVYIVRMENGVLAMAGAETWVSVFKLTALELLRIQRHPWPEALKREL